ncbi:MAG: hypothetical protein RIS76_4261 [Verrucomicrobiota bacterium]|jgi:hypothetical protein
MELASRILASLRPDTSATARELASRLHEDKSEVNSQLYTLQMQGKAQRDADFRWFLASARLNAGRDTDTAMVPVETESARKAVRMAGNQASTLPGNHLSAASQQRIGKPSEIVWTDEQLDLINAAPEDRILVEAGPGTGKTAVACARVARLLSKHELNPCSILMISFTRTAVAEMKNRIRQWADSGRVSAVNISTLDQAAFTFGIGCGQKFEDLMDGFEGNIQNAVEQFRSKNPLLVEYAASLRHVIIDEAQDLTGPRSQLVRLLIETLPKTTGVTVFADEAQAIYGFTTDMDGDDDASEQFLKAFEPAVQGFKAAQLETVHRTQDDRILKLFAESRKAMLNGSIADVIAVAEAKTKCLGSEVQDLPLQDGDLVLYRKRASALMHAQFCQKLFRLRLPNHPAAVFPWVALAFSHSTQPVVSRENFNALWKAQVPESLRDGFTDESAWALLHRFAKDRDRVNLTRLRKLLSRPRPPVEFCHLDYGGRGPVFSTIHASKGREADRVFLMLPHNLVYLEGNAAVDRVEEARVFYVGSTRVRSEFLRGRAPTMVGAGRLDQSGRRVAQILALKKLPKFQIGLAGDIDDAAPVSRISALCSTDAAAAAHQAGLLKLWSEAVTADTCPDVGAVCKPHAVAGGRKEYLYRFASGSSTVAWSGPGLHKDLWTACRAMKDRARCTDLRPPDDIKHLRLIGLRTCAVGDDPALLANLREPFASSGFWLAPMIVGFPSIFLRFQ